MGCVEEVAVRVLNFRVGHLVPQNFLIVIRVMQNVHDLLDVSLRSCGVFHFELISDQVEPVLNFLLVRVTLVLNPQQHLDCFIEVVPRVIHLNDGAPEHGILFRKELFAWSKALNRCIAHSDRLFVLEARDPLLHHGLEDGLCILNARLLRSQSPDQSHTVFHGLILDQSSDRCCSASWCRSEDLL